MRIDKAIGIIDKKICKNIGQFKTIDRGFLSQNILSDLRNLVEHTSLKAFSRGNDLEITYENMQEANEYVKTVSELNFLHKFHRFLQMTTSHYTFDEGNSERLMLKYYEFMLKIRELLERKYDISILSNIEEFPLKLDPHLNEYYEKIAKKIKFSSMNGYDDSYNDRYYIRKIKPFFVNQKVYYEVTFTTANDSVSKFDRIIAFTDIDIMSNYAVKFWIRNDFIDVFWKKMPIRIIENYEISIRPCELNNLARIFDMTTEISTGHVDYKELMLFIFETGMNLTQFVCMPESYYIQIRKMVNSNSKKPIIFDLLDNCRKIIINDFPGANTLKYLLYKMNNKIIKNQLSDKECHILSDLKVNYGCIPFDQMPFNSSLKRHNPRLVDLIDCIDIHDREHELFARMIKNNTEIEGQLFTNKKDIVNFVNVDNLIKRYNDRLYNKHENRKIYEYKGNLYIKGYEENTVRIIETLKELTMEGIGGYESSVDYWLESTTYSIDCEEKKKALRSIFDKSKVALIYGAAGTGKTTLIDHISNFFNEKKKIYLSNTNPAVDNLKQKVHSSNCSYYTIAKYLTHSHNDTDCDVLFIDECSTVSNDQMYEVINKSTFKLLVLVGDIYQIESITFGNWFDIIRSFVPETSVFELENPYRSKSENLLDVWRKVRKLDDDILEYLTRNNYSSNLDESIFQRTTDDEIVLCLNYDGLYGINNINKFLQGSNHNPEFKWGMQSYKVGDPILFNESNRFHPLIFNNSKGKIVDIKVFETEIEFDILLDRPINEMQAYGYDFELVNEPDETNSTIRFTVNKYRSTDEDDDENATDIVPFQVAYAISIHKAQGLEYRSVKIVITDEIGEQITHNIFYTAITRARESLKIYWTPESENIILSSFNKKIHAKDVSLISVKNSLKMKKRR
ncbi:ATP-dependent DNA helicase [Jeotgalicoccus marinus]|uniref:ATP-dependent DNA helicase n=1 Tax=Jeotgalicoccus marinus TaxID=516700 RepID=UPI00041E8E1D|nr:ATP-dependent RecD-like DNA helicase [Jeotgalicoccus marinus]